MSDSKPTGDIEERLTTLELDVRGLRADLEGLREMIASEHKHFIGLNGSQDRVVDAVIDRLDLIEDRLEPAFAKAFPNYERCLDEIDAIITTPRKR